VRNELAWPRYALGRRAPLPSQRDSSYAHPQPLALRPIVEAANDAARFVNAPHRAMVNKNRARLLLAPVHTADAA
jgi:hypothetical protein